MREEVREGEELPAGKEIPAEEGGGRGSRLNSEREFRWEGEGVKAR